MVGAGRTCVRASTVMWRTSPASCARWRCCIPESGALCTAKGTASTVPWGEPCGSMGKPASIITTTSTIFPAKAVVTLEAIVTDLGGSFGETLPSVPPPFVPGTQ